MVIPQVVYVNLVTLVLAVISCVLDSVIVRMGSVSVTNVWDIKERSVKSLDVPVGQTIAVVVVHVT